MLKFLKVAALGLLVSTGLASAATIDGTASIGGTYVSDTDPLGVGSTITLTANSFSATGDFVGATFDPTPLNLTASVGSNVGVTFDFPTFDFVINSTTSAFKAFGIVVFGGMGVADEAGYDASPSSWVLTIAGDAQNGSYSLFIETPPGTVPTVPVPAGLPLLAGGLALFGVLRKRATA